MSGRTISGTYSTSVVLTNPADNPVTVLAPGKILNGTGVGLQANANTSWTLSNDGQITGYGVGASFAGAAAVTNNSTINAAATSGSGFSYDTASKVFIPLSGGLLVGGGSVTNTTSGLISGYFEGLAISNAGSVTNAGIIQAGTNGFGVVLAAGGSVTNQSNGIIRAARYGVLTVKDPAAITNAGLISSSSVAGVEMLGGGTVANGAGGTVSGGNYAIQSGGTLPSTVTNQGRLTGLSVAGVALFDGGSISNGVSGVIQGAVYGVAATSPSTAVSAATLTNAGSIGGTTRVGVLFVEGGSVSNSGTITGGYFGVRITNQAGSVSNSGFIASSHTFTGSSSFDAAGVDVAAGGTVVNNASGNIRATWKGVEIGSISTTVGGTLINAGTVFASNADGSTGAAVWIHGPGVISNASSGTIAGGPFGIVAYFQTTIVNFGTILGTEFAIDAFSGYADRVIVGPGASFTGTVTGGNSIGSTIVSTLEFASGGSVGTMTSIGSQFIDFGRIEIDPGATWTASGANTLAAGVTLSDHGSLVIGSGTLSGGGVATLSGAGGAFAGVTVSGAGALWTGAASLVVGEQGDGALLVANQGTLQTAGNAVTDPLQGLVLADAAGVLGNAVVTGSKSLLNNTGRFVVGGSGLASLLVEGGGTVTTSPGSASIAGAVIADAAGAGGSAVRVNGAGSQWNVAGSLVVGNVAAGLLQITSGGSVVAGRVLAGASAGGSGIISVAGPGSGLSVGAELALGGASSAELSILGGASVSASKVDIGVSAGGTGNVDIEGAGSHLDIAGDLTIGDAGVGVLTLGGGTELTVGTSLAVGVNGVVNQFGGTIDPLVVRNQGQAGGAGTLIATGSILNDGTLFALNGTETVSAPLITGNGVLAVQSNGDLLLNVGSVTAGETISFADGSGVLTIGTLAGFAATIGNFLAGDTILLPGVPVAASSFDSTTHVLTLFDQGHAVAGALQFGASVTDGSAISVNSVTPCFAAGTRIGTARGEIAVDDVRVGDRVAVATDGRLEPIVWIGMRRIDCARHPQPHKVWPVRVAAHAFGASRPWQDLWLSPDHAVFVDGVLIPVKHLVNGTSVVQVPRAEVTYYHVELARHAVLLAEGLPVESYLDTGDRANFANAGGAVTLHPDFASGVREAAGCAPLVVTGRRLAAVRRWVNALAAATACRSASA